MSHEKKMSQDLKTFEAELAALVPRTDRLDRDRLIFLAGEQSAAASNRRATAYGRWLWPAAFSGMTAVAAMLAVIVLLRPEPQVVVRLVEVPTEPVVAEDPSPSETTEPTPSEPEPAEPRDDSPADIPDAGGSSFWAWIGLPWPPDRPAAWPNSTRPNRRLMLQILAEGRDPWPQPAATPTQTTQPQTAPIPYRQMLKQMLDEQARADRPALNLLPAAEDLPQSSQRAQRKGLKVFGCNRCWNSLPKNNLCVLCELCGKSSEKDYAARISGRPTTFQEQPLSGAKS